ncbi:MAG: DUF1176 domain-containing protein [Treponema sp.]|nr:DUF1176 domain-containing protein [Treponema sp.]
MMKKLILLAVAISFALPPCFSAEITIPMANGENKTIGSTYISEYSEGEYTDMGSKFSLVDANQDGYIDLLEYDKENSGAYNMAYNLYIYNPKEKCFDAPYEFYNISIGKDGTVSEFFKGRGLGDFGDITTWKWNGKKYIELYNDSFIISDDANTCYTKHTEFSAKGEENKVVSVKYYKEVSGKKISISEKEFNKAQNDKFGN